MAIPTETTRRPRETFQSFAERLGLTWSLTELTDRLWMATLNGIGHSCAPLAAASISRTGVSAEVAMAAVIEALTEPGRFFISKRSRFLFWLCNDEEEVEMPIFVSDESGA